MVGAKIGKVFMIMQIFVCKQNMNKHFSRMFYQNYIKNKMKRKNVCEILIKDDYKLTSYDWF